MQLGITQNTHHCTLCPRKCGVERTRATGYCGAPDSLQVANVCIHRGEEPPLNPIVNIFFSHCNLHCIYCQNYQISGRHTDTTTTPSTPTNIDALADLICQQLNTQYPTPDTPLLGLVTATHYLHHIPSLLETIHRRGVNPIVVYNSGGYESVDSLRDLEGLVDIYLPDYKYADPALADLCSHAPDYPEVADAALREMIWQVGSGLKIDDSGHAYRGLIIRHLVLPGHVYNSLAVLDRLSALTDRLSILTPLHLSLMSQYYPPHPGLPAPFDRTLTPDEYDTVVRHALHLGFTEGWIQSLDAQLNYRPDFNQANPFQIL